MLAFAVTLALVVTPAGPAPAPAPAPATPARAAPAPAPATPARAAAPATPARAAAPAASTRQPVRLIVVTSLQDAGPGSLRAAIRAANSGPRRRTTVIDFAVRGVITLTSPLPLVPRRVIIDGRSAPRYVTGGPPVVDLNCQATAGSSSAADPAAPRSSASRSTTPPATASASGPATSRSTATTSG